MIDRSRLHFCLRPKTLLAALCISAALCALLPAVSLVVLLAGCLSFLGCWLAVVLMALASWGVLLAGGAGVFFGSFLVREDPKRGVPMIGGGMVAAAIGGLLIAFFYDFYRPVIGASFLSFGGCRDGARWVLLAVWVEYAIYLWSWLVLAGALTAAGLTILAVGVLNLETGLKYSLLKVGYTCPACHFRGVPLFRCPNPACGQPVVDLRPTVFGLWNARCGHCKQALMRTTDLGGRLRLYEKICRRASCGRDQHRTVGERSGFYLPVVGAVSSGKSNLMITSVRQFEERFAPNNGLEVRFIDPEQEQGFRQSIALLDQGKRLDKTAAGKVPKALNLDVSSPAARSLLYLYDAAGEDYQEGEKNLAAHEFHRFLDGILFLVDPFAEQSARGELRIGAQQNNASSTDAADILGRVLPFWENMLRVSATQRFSLPIAVAVTKMDACGLEARLQAPFAPDEKRRSFREAAAVAEADSGVVRAFLVESGLGNFVRTLEERFERVRYFGVSALGRTFDPRDTTPFQPRGVLAPLVWLAYHSRALSGSGLLRVGRNIEVFIGRCARGSEGTAALLVVWAGLLAAVGGAVAGLIWFLGVAWGLGTSAAVFAGLLSWLSLRASGARPFAALANGLRHGRRQLLDALGGAAGQPRQVLAWVGSVGAILGVGLFGWWWWPGGLVACLVLGGMAAVSLGDS